jgi:hypothetical protein
MSAIAAVVDRHGTNGSKRAPYERGPMLVEVCQEKEKGTRKTENISTETLN